MITFYVDSFIFSSLLFSDSTKCGTAAIIKASIDPKRLPVKGQMKLGFTSNRADSAPLGTVPVEVLLSPLFNFRSG